METTYASNAAGGQQSQNYIPNLTTLAQGNVSFSNSTQLGGWRPSSGTTWTMGALFATTSGLPFAFPGDKYLMSERENFASGCTTLGDILERNGYHNAFLCGSDASFAGRKKYFQQHGNYDIYDLFSAKEEGYIPADYYVWWGYEDAILYEIAKDKLLSFAQSEEPFNLTMLTVDTHFVEGYVCSQCQNTYDSMAANIVACADRQVYDFIQWCSQQDFYEDTVIVITGDHPRMDSYLVEGTEFADRTIYNCFLNCDVPDTTRLTNREFIATDMFPTILSALGFQIEGEHLGLGVNLFSAEESLAERLGFHYLYDEFLKYSSYYISKFS